MVIRRYRIRCLPHSLRSIAHGHTDPGCFQHGQVIEMVPESQGFPNGQALHFRQESQGMPLGNGPMGDFQVIGLGQIKARLWKILFLQKGQELGDICLFTNQQKLVDDWFLGQEGLKIRNQRVFPVMLASSSTH